jgi:Protein of unknown function (DUF2530)
VSQQQPLDPPMVPFAVAGIVIFALATGAVWIFDGPRGWLEICLAGFAWGFVGLAAMIPHDRKRRARRAAGR